MVFFTNSKKGDVVDLCVASGALGGKVKKNLVELRKNETIEGLKKINKPNFLNLPDGYLGFEKSHKLKIEKFIEKIPDLTLTHYKKIITQIIENYQSLLMILQDITSALL